MKEILTQINETFDIHFVYKKSLSDNSDVQTYTHLQFKDPISNKDELFIELEEAKVVWDYSPVLLTKLMNKHKTVYFKLNDNYVHPILIDNNTETKTATIEFIK